MRKSGFFIFHSKTEQKMCGECGDESGKLKSRGRVPQIEKAGDPSGFVQQLKGLFCMLIISPHWSRLKKHLSVSVINLQNKMRDKKLSVHTLERVLKCASSISFSFL